MQLQGKALRVTIYIGESDHYHGKALHTALLHFLRAEGAAGATVLRGLAGFGAHSRIHTATIVDLSSDLPIRIEWIDDPEVVERLLPQLRQMVDDGLITVEEVDVLQYAPGRRPDPLSQPVGEVMRTAVVSVPPAAGLDEIVTLLLQKGYRSVPVVDNGNHPIGIITDGDLLERAGLRTRLDLQADLPAEGWQRQLADLRAQGKTARSLMTTPVLTVHAGASLRQAVELMIERDLKRLPVVDDDGRLAGWISRVDILRTLEYHHAVPGSAEELSGDGTTIRDLMYRDVPTVTPQASLEAVLQALEQNRRRRAVVVDEERHVLGIITDGDLLRRSRSETRLGLLERLRSLLGGHSDVTPASLLDATETAADLMTAPVFTISAEASPNEALRLMLTHEVKRLPVVDADGRLVGLLGRASLLRGLLDAA